MALEPTSPSDKTGFSSAALGSVEAAAGVSLGRGMSAASLGAELLPFWARLAFRRRPPSPPEACFLPSPSVNSSPDVVPVLRSFLLPKVLKKEERRLSVVPVLAAPGLVGSVAVAEVPLAMVPVTGSIGGCVIGVSSCVAVDGIVADSSLTGTAGVVSVAAGLAASFLPNRPPKIEARLFGFGRVSRAAGVVAISGTTAPVDSAPVATGEISSTAVDFAPAGRTGSPTTRAAAYFSNVCKCRKLGHSPTA